MRARALAVRVVGAALVVLLSGAAPSIAQDDVEHQHPDWFKEPDRYRPCPANVEFPGGRHTCLDVGK